MKLYFIGFWLIIILAFFLRFWQLGQIPSSLNWDEVAFGYNAYAIGTDGKDEFGQFLPYKYLESYGDYKPPLYAYLTVLPVKLFGLTEFAVRFASALFGSLTVIVAYFLVKEIFHHSKNRDEYALFSMLFLAISPWHINLSRAAFEANVATFLITAGVWLFLLSIRRKKMILIISAISFALSFYTFNTARIVVPVLVLVLAIGFYKQLLKMKIAVAVALVVGIGLILPIIPFLLSPQAGLRYKEVNIFSNIDLIKTANQEVVNDNNAPWSNLLHNRRVVFAREYIKHYFDNFNPNFLFISGDENHRFGTKDVGLLYFVEIPLLFLGFIVLFRERGGYWWILPVWMLIGIIPAATARETPHALRIETIIPTLQIISAIGLVTLIIYIHRLKLSRALQNSIVAILFLLILGNVLYYVHGYYRHYQRESAGEWQYGYKDAIRYASSVKGKYDKISMTEQLGRPYAYVLFYEKVDPGDFRKNSKVSRDVFGFVTVKEYGKYVFDRHPENYIPKEEKVLYINSPEAVPGNANILKEFLYPDGYVILTAYTL